MNVDLVRLMTVIGRINPAIWDAITPWGRATLDRFLALPQARGLN